MSEWGREETIERKEQGGKKKQHGTLAPKQLAVAQ
jgi:hypothetical protein